MEKNLVYTTCGTCSKLLDVTVENDRVKRVQFIGGCHGNSQGIAEGKLRRYEARNRRLETERFLQSVYETNHFRTMYFLWYLLIGLVAGWLANLLVKGHGSGLVVNLIVGIVGGILGGWILSLLGLVAVGTLGSLIASVVGAVVLLWIASLLARSSKKHSSQ